MILQMILFKHFLLESLVFSWGLERQLLWGMAIKNTTLAFLFPWQLLFLQVSLF